MLIVAAALKKRASSATAQKLLYVWGVAANGENAPEVNPAAPSVPSWTVISANNLSTFGIDSTGKLYSWGANTSGQLGDGTTVAKSSPVQIGTGVSWTAVAAGWTQALGISTTGSLYAWGTSAQAEVPRPIDFAFGDATTSDGGIPTPHELVYHPTTGAANTVSWIQVSAGLNHSAAIRSDGIMFAWGRNNVYQLGDGTTLNRSSPVQIGTKTWTSVSAGGVMTLAIDTAGLLWGWGKDAVAMGDGYSDTLDYSARVKITSPTAIGGGRFIERQYNTGTYKIAASANHVLVIDNNNIAYQMGASGVLMNEITGFGVANANQYYPIQVRNIEGMGGNIGGVENAASTSTWTAVATGPNHALMIRQDGRLYSWGTGNEVGRGGGGYKLLHWRPGRINSRSWASVVAGGNFTLAIAQNGALWAWGTNTSGQLGDGSYISRSTPVQIGSSSWSMVAAGSSHAVGITTDGRLFAWGNGAYLASGGTNGTTGDQFGQHIPNQVWWTDNISFTTLAPQRISPQAGITQWGRALDVTGQHYFWGKGESWNGDGSLINRSFCTIMDGGPVYWSTIDSGGSHAVGIATDGSLYVWGKNLLGQLGVGDAIERQTYTKLGTSSWVAVSAGQLHTLGIRSGGTLFSWGDGATGKLGDGSGITRSSPVQIGSSSWIAVSAASSHSVAIRSDGMLFTWGRNQYGQLGDGTTIDRISPVQVGSSSWIAISAGRDFSMAIRSGGTLYAWGRNNYGQLGNSSTISNSSPVQIGSSSWTAISAGESHNLGMYVGDTRLYSWGSNGQGELGDGTYISKSSPTVVGQISVDLGYINTTTNWAPVFRAGRNISFATRTDRLGIFSWGLDDAVNALGRRPGGASPIQLGSSSWTAVAAGDAHSGAIRSDGMLFTWGRNQYGQLGDGTSINRSSPVQIGSSSWTAITQGSSVTFARTTNKQTFAWGRNNVGQLGDASTINKSSPVQIGINISPIVAMAAAGTVNYFIDEAGTFYSVGNSSGWNGRFNAGISENFYPRQLSISSWTAVSSGNSHALAIRTDGLLFAWGTNTNGQVGDGTTINKSSFIQIGSSSWTAIKATNNHSLAVRSDGSLFTWGLNSSGQLGDGTTVSKSSPVQIGSSSWTAVSGGEVHSVAIRSGGTLFSWGSNAQGQLGTGMVSHQWTRLTSPFATGWATAQIAGVSAALTTDGLLYTWGTNAFGGVGDGTTITRTFPAQLGSSSWTAISCGTDEFMVAIRSDGILFAWGRNNYGQLGDGTTINSSSPVQIGSDTWTMIKAGTGNVIAIRSDQKLFTWGRNTAFGLLGDSTTINKSSPVQIGNSSLNWIDCDMGFQGAMAVTSSNLLYVWGDGDNQTAPTSTYQRGQLGDCQYWEYMPVKANNGTQTVDSWTTFYAARYHALAISATGTLYAWGQNSFGQLGDGTTIERFYPVQIGSSSWTAVSGGREHSIAIRSDGMLFTWGRNNFGQLGDGTSIDRSSPVQIGSDSWTALHQGSSDLNSGAIRSDGSLWLWGSNQYGQLGDGDSITYNVSNLPYTTKTGLTNRSSPTAISNYDGIWGNPSTKTWKKVSIGRHATMAIDSDDFLWGWGFWADNVAGINWAQPDYLIWPSAQTSWNAVGAGGNHTLLLRSDNLLFAYGLNSAGQVGDGTTITKVSPVQIGSSTWSAIKAGQSHSVAIRSDGYLFTWGLNSTGQLGDASTVNKSSPVQIGSSSWTAISGGLNHTLAIRSGGTLFTWGANASGQLGDGTTVNKSSPVALQTVYSSSSWTAISAGNTHTAAIRSDGKLFTWGLGTSGQTGDGHLGFGQIKISPAAGTQVEYSWTMVATGLSHTAAIRSDGYLFAWGLGTSGQLGDGTAITKSSPVQIGSSSWIAVTAGAAHTMAIRSGGTLFTWGANAAGQLGDTTVIGKSSPVQIGSSSWIAISAGSSHNVALRSDSILFGWGHNVLVQLGDGTTISKSSPVQIGSSSWTAISAGATHTVAIRSGGTLFAWGRNTYGQLGNNSGIAQALSPVQIGSSSWTAVAAGLNHTLAVTSGGTLYGWGRNTSAQAGINSLINASSPVVIGGGWSTSISAADLHSAAIDTAGILFTAGTNTAGQLARGLGGLIPHQIGLSSWTMISAGDAFTAAIRSGGTLFTWGLNSSGQLGDSTTVNKSSPVQIGSSSWTAIYAGNTHALGLIGNTVYAWGGNSDGQLGIGSFLETYSTRLTNRSSPVQIGATGEGWPSSFTEATQVFAGGNTSFAIKTNSLLLAWGGGDNQNTASSRARRLAAGWWINWPVKSTPFAKFKQIVNSATESNLSNAGAHMLELSGKLITMGNTDNAEAGFVPAPLSSAGPVLWPHYLNASGDNWQDVWYSRGAGWALKSGSLYTWGYDNQGQQGRGINSVLDTNAVARSFSTSTPTIFTLGLPSGKTWTRVVGGATFSLALDSAGMLYSAGGSSLHSTTSMLGRRPGGTVPFLNGYLVSRGVAVSKAKLGKNHGMAITTSSQLWVLGGNMPNSGNINLNGAGSLASYPNNPQTNARPPSVFTNLGPYVISPAQITNTGRWSSWTAVSSNSSMDITLAVRHDGLPFAWGRNQNNEIDGQAYTWTNKVSSDRNSPRPLFHSQEDTQTVLLKSPAVTWSITESNIYPVLRNSLGEIWYKRGSPTAVAADAVVTSFSSPVQIGSSSWVAVQAGRYHTLGVTSGGTLFAWGRNERGQTGTGLEPYFQYLTDNYIMQDVSIPTRVGDVGFWSSVSAGGTHAAGISASGRLLIWGRQNYGQTGTFTGETRISQIGSSSWTAVAAGRYISAALRSDGKLFVWGRNNYGQLADNGNMALPSGASGSALGLRVSPVAVNYTSSWTIVSTKRDHVVAVRSDGKLFAWGLNSSGQLGDGTTINKSSPTQIGSSSWIAISAGATHTVGISSNNQLWSWGLGTSGQAGDGAFISAE